MPLSIGKGMTVNVSLCGAIPRSQTPISGASITLGDTSRTAENITTFSLNKQGANSTPGCSLKTCDRSTIDGAFASDRPPISSLLLSKAVSQSEDSQDTVMPSSAQPRLVNHAMSVIEPPRWAVPAKGEARLEVSCNNDVMVMCIKFRKC